MIKNSDPNNFFSEEKLERASKNKKTIEAYDKNAVFYANKFDSYGINFEDIDRVFKLNESGSDKVLELGCGNGRDAEYIISKIGKDNYLGIDASREMINLAKEKVPHVTFLVGDMRDLEFSLQKGGQAHETYGMIFSFASVLHLKHEELVVLVDKCHRWLKKGGILFISTKYGDYREEKIVNLGDEKYYYFYKPEDIEKLCPYKFFVIYKNVQDIEGQSYFEIILRKI